MMMYILRIIQNRQQAFRSYTKSQRMRKQGITVARLGLLNQLSLHFAFSLASFCLIQHCFML